MSFVTRVFGIGRLVAGCLLLSAACLQARDLTYDPWKGESPPPEAGARILAAYRIQGRDVQVWSRMPSRPYHVLGVLRSFETVGFTHEPLRRLAQEAFRRGGDAIVLLAPRHLPGGWIRGDDAGVTIHGERFTVLVLRASSGSHWPPRRRSVPGSGTPLLSCDDPA